MDRSHSVHMISKVVRSGDVVEVYSYSSAIEVGQERGYDIVRRDGTTVDDDDHETRREDSMFRSRQAIRRLIWCNQGQYTKFVTLTYAETVLEVKKVRRDITTFVQAMRRRGYDMRYLYVLEHQTARGLREGNEGCWHVHMVLFIDRYIPKADIEMCWRHGWVDITAIDCVRNLGAYVCKYITKDNTAEFGAHVYECSQGLKRPVEERIYLEGLGDTTMGLYPQQVVDALEVKYQSQMRHDYRDDLGAGHAQIVRYVQGRWRGDDLIEQYRDVVDDDEP